MKTPENWVGDNGQAGRAATFRGPTLGAAIKRVRMHLGDTAVLLGTRKRRRLFGLGPDVVEVMAVPAPVDETPQHQVVAAATGSASPAAGISETLAELLRAAGVQADMAVQLAERTLQGSRNLISTKQLGDMLGTVIGRLVGGAYQIDVLPGTKRVIAFIGPAGCGKTTSLVKLACEMVLAGGRSVEVISTDTVRPGAADQLARYAAILDIPFALVHTSGELKRLCSSTTADLVFVDTPGCSWRDRQEIASLAATLEAAAPAEVHAVIGATTDPELATRMIAAYRPLGVDRLLLTRMDEIRTYGPVVNIACRVRIPLSYLATGAGVPGKVQVPAFGALASALIGGDTPAETAPRSSFSRLEVPAV